MSQWIVQLLLFVTWNWGQEMTEERKGEALEEMGLGLTYIYGRIS